MSGPMFNFSGCQFNQNKEQEYQSPQKNETSRENRSYFSLLDIMTWASIGIILAFAVSPKFIGYASPPSTTTIINNR